MIVERNSSFIFLVNELNNLLAEEYKFELDRVISSAPYDTEVICYKDSVINDRKIFLNLDIETNLSCNRVGKWINRRLFTEMLTDLSEGRMTYIHTKLIRMHIGINMAMKMLPDKVAKEEWRTHILDLCYARFWAVNTYYATKICELPF
jgi:hypothetical protein